MAFAEWRSFEDAPRLGQLLSYLWVAWRLSVDAKRPATVVEPIIKALCVADLYTIKLPLEPKEPGGGWVQECDSIWVRPGSQNLLKRLDEVSATAINLTTKRIAPLFYEKNDIYRHLNDVQSSEIFAQWRRDGFLELEATITDESDQRLLSNLMAFGDELPFTIPFPGAILVGYDGEAEPGVVWIGIRQDLGLLQRTPRERVRRLWHPEGFITIHGQNQWRNEWCQEVRDDVLSLTQSSDPNFHSLATIVCRELPEKDGPTLALPVRITVGGDAGTIFRNHFGELPFLFERQEKRCLRVITNSECEQAEECVLEALGPRAVPGLQIEILGPDLLLNALGREPWLWSKYLGAERRFQLVKDDPRRLVSLFVSVQARRQIFTDPCPAPIHPALDLGEVRPGCRLLITGRPRTGKTIALLQCAQAWDDEHVLVLVGPTCTMEDWELCERIINETTRHYPGWWLFAIDDLHLALKTNRVVMERLALLVTRLAGKAGMVASCDDSGVLLAVGFDDSLLHCNLDDPPEAFELAVLDAHNRDGEKVRAAEYPGLVRMLKMETSIIVGDVRIGSLVDYWASDRYAPTRANRYSLAGRRESQANMNRQDLLRPSHSPVQQETLRVLATLAALNAEEVCTAYIRAYVEESLRQVGISFLPGEVAEGIRSLRIEGVISGGDERIDSRDAALGMQPGAGELERAPALVRWTAVHGRKFDTSAAARVLYCGLNFLDDAEQIATARTLLQEFPDMDAFRIDGTMTALLHARLRAGEASEYLQDVREALQATDNPVAVVERLACQLTTAAVATVLGGMSALEELIVGTMLPLEGQAAVLAWLLAWHPDGERIVAAVVARTTDPADRQVLLGVTPAKIL